MVEIIRELPAAAGATTRRLSTAKPTAASTTTSPTTCATRTGIPWIRNTITFSVAMEVKAKRKTHHDKDHRYNDNEWH
jgi:hypothetical protein